MSNFINRFAFPIRSNVSPIKGRGYQSFWVRLPVPLLLLLLLFDLWMKAGWFYPVNVSKFWLVSLLIALGGGNWGFRPFVPDSRISMMLEGLESLPVSFQD